MKALFCLYSAPLIESTLASSTPLASNLHRGRAQGRQGNGGHGERSEGLSFPPGQTSEVQGFGSEHFPVLLPPIATEDR